MSMPDLNLLITLDALLSEGSVARAAQRLRLSPSAMSRALARLRDVTGDPLLVRAGRGLTPTPRALELRERVHALVLDAESALRPAGTLRLDSLQRSFTLRCSDGFAENFGPRLLERLQGGAPGVRLHFLPKRDKDNAPLRDGAVDLDTGVVGHEAGPELRVRMLFRDRFVGAVRAGHPLATGSIDAARYAAGRHVMVARRGGLLGPVDEALSAQGLSRDVAVTVGSFATALALAGASDLIATVPERHTGRLRAGLHSFALPLTVAEITISMIWHPRLDADPAQQWLRACVKAVCDEQLAAEAAV
ncbi:LysR family transcriptional regulator [Chromobacterium haemolyticum]|uniref:LysR family transcriptional regulator n=1 Tax=Chromobacterium TaxID=535 RepID=UPI00405624DC